MAKQQRAKSRPVGKAARTSSAALSTSPSIAVGPGETHSPVTRPGYLDAVALYEQGLAALQAHEYSRAAATLRSVLSGYPEEKELHERVKLYLNVCERQLLPHATSPSTPQERVFAATVAFNAGAYDEALVHLRAANAEAPEDDYALYMLAAVLALRDQADEAIPLLLRAIELNPDNRALARHDPDLDTLREHEIVRTALEALPPPKIERRRPQRRAR